MPSGPLIAIVDDDEALRNATKGLVRALGFRVEVFGSADELLKFDDLRDVGCLIADVQMPQMTGIELYHRLLESGVGIPTLLMTAYPDDGMRDRALAEGVVCYLTKPFNKDALLACIHSALGRGQAGKSEEDNSP